MKKHGFGKARMALARKMAVKLHRMWVDEKDYQAIDITSEEIKTLENIKANRKKANKKKNVVKAIEAKPERVKRVKQVA